VAYAEMVALVVDDFATMRRIIKKVLKDLQFGEVLEAENGVEALKILKSSKIDLIVSDWNMPEMGGLDLLKLVRGDEKLKSIPFLMVTAEAQKENIMEAVKAKVSNYVVKPFTAAILEEKIAKIIPNN